MMKIDQFSILSEIIEENESAIDAIASINSNFIKLKNPVLRKILTPIVNIKQAAAIGGVHSDILLNELKKIGFIIKNEKFLNNNQSTNHIQMNNLEIVKLDVRPSLASGVDPFNLIMDKLKELNDSQQLLIINTFEPIPLLNILKDKGYQYETTRPADGEVHTRLYKADSISPETAVKTVNKKDWDFEDALKAFEGKMTEVDVRHLEMPLPMVTILEDVEKIEAESALFVHHNKLPQYLIPELENRGFAFVTNEIDEQNIKLIIYKS